MLKAPVLLLAVTFSFGISSIALAQDQSLQEPPKLPPAPPRGGVLKVPHPGAAKGLMRIEKDGTYQYRVPLREKTKSSSFRFTSMTPPEISGGNGITFESMYGESNVFGFNYDYEWQLRTRFGAFGGQLGTGIATGRGSGTFVRDNSKAREAYNLYIVPLSAFVIYRFEYVRRQWVVPYVLGGGTYYGLAESRDDGKSPQFAGAAAVGGGGGLLFSITAFDAQSAFRLGEEYGIADMYVNLEARAMQGLNKDIDFTSQAISLGVTVDF
ncbi:MAG: hypothetical protein ACK5P6_09565 [Pseudobdellovibrionaceae bacterium]